MKNKALMFCPKCKSMMVPSGGRFKCRKCGYFQKEEPNKNIKIPKNKEYEKSSLEKKIPTIQIIDNVIHCPLCHSIRYEYISAHLLPNADYEVILERDWVRCEDCGYKWCFDCRK